MSGQAQSDSGSEHHTFLHHEMSAEEHEKLKTLRRAAGASFIGNFIEWFDYASYGYLAAVIGIVFIPSEDKNIQLISAFAIFAMSFILRPIGGLIWGIWGDKYGRRSALSWSILIMSGSTFLIAFLPGHKTIGLASAICLLVLRMIQGFSASGEYAGAGTFLAEYAPPKKRGMYTALVPASTAVGLLAASFLTACLFHFLSDAQIESWGWRIPFLLAGPLGMVGRYIRLHLEDSPTYIAMKEAISGGQKQSVPMMKVLRDHTRTICVSFGVAALNAVAFYLLLSYMPTYVEQELGFSSDLATALSTAPLIVYIGSIMVMGHLSDTHGRRKMLLIASVAFIVLTVPIFMLMGTRNVWVVLLCEIAFAIMLTINDGTLATFLAESFPTEVRYTGFALSFNTANALLGGTAPTIATALIQYTGSSMAPAYYLAFIAFLALTAMLAIPQHATSALDREQAESAQSQG